VEDNIHRATSKDQLVAALCNLLQLTPLIVITLQSNLLILGLNVIAFTDSTIESEFIPNNDDIEQ
jgi:hypothetical protein